MLARGLDARDHLAPLDARQLVQLGGHPVEGGLRELDGLRRAARSRGGDAGRWSRRSIWCGIVGGAGACGGACGGLGARRVVPVLRSSRRAPSASPGATSTTRRGGSGARGSSGTHRAGDPVGLALARRAAQVRPRQRERPAGSPRRRDSSLPEGIEERVEVLLGCVRLGPPDPDPEAVEPAEEVQPLAVGMGLAIARHVGEERRDPAADRAVGRRRRRARSSRATRTTRAWLTVPSRSGAAPSRRSPGRRSSHFPTRVSSSGAVGQRRAELDDVQAGLPARNGGAPADGSVGQKPDRPQQVGCAGFRSAHRSDGTTGASDRYGRAMRARARVSDTGRTFVDASGEVDG